MRTWRFKAAAWLLALALFGAAVPGAAAEQKPADVRWAPLAGIFGDIFVHETGHAVTALALGFHVESFRPFPNYCVTAWRPGCVIIRGRTWKGLLPFVKNRAAGVAVSFMGTGFSLISVAVTAPLLPTVKNEFNRTMLDTMVYAQVREWPLYVVSDMIGYGGDWGSIAKDTGVPLWVFLPFSIGAFVGLDGYHKRYQEQMAERFPDEDAETGGSKGLLRVPLPRLALGGAFLRPLLLGGDNGALAGLAAVGTLPF